MPTCDANTLAGLAACFNGLTPDQQKAIQTYLLCQLANGGGGGGGAVWGAITGTLSNQTDLNTALNAKLAKASNLSDVVSAATSFANIKQAATTAATGVAELATVAEAGLGTDSSRIVTPGGIFPPEADVTSGTTTNIGAATTSLVRITGTTTITAFDTVAAGIRRLGRFAGILTLTHNATTLILPGGANITTAAGDTFEAYSLGSGNWVVSAYQKASGGSVVAVPAATTTNQGIAELATNAEVLAGTDTTRIVTPSGLAAALASRGLNTTSVIKSSDQTVTNDATQTNDTELFLPMLANSFYSLEFYIIASGNDITGDYACSLTFPALANVVNVLGESLAWNPAVGGLTWAADFASTTQVWPASNSARVISGVDPAGTFMPLYGKIVLYNTTAGNIQFRFANSAAGVGRTSTTRAGSTLILQKLN